MLETVHCCHEKKLSAWPKTHWIWRFNYISLNPCQYYNNYEQVFFNDCVTFTVPNIPVMWQFVTCKRQKTILASWERHEALRGQLGTSWSPQKQGSTYVSKGKSNPSTAFRLFLKAVFTVDLERKHTHTHINQRQSADRPILKQTCPWSGTFLPISWVSSDILPVSRR